jgi:hypothetical protein
MGSRLRRRPGRVTDSDINLKIHARGAAPGDKAETRAGVFILGPDRLETYRGWLKRDPIRIHFGRADLLHIRPDCVGGAASQAQEIEVSRRPIGLILPQPQEHGSFEHEAVVDFRCPEAVKEPLAKKALIRFW